MAAIVYAEQPEMLFQIRRGLIMHVLFGAKAVEQDQRRQRGSALQSPVASSGQGLREWHWGLLAPCRRQIGEGHVAGVGSTHPISNVPCA